MSEKPAFRRARPDEGPLLREITRAAYAKWVPLIGREPLPMTADHVAAVRDHIVEFAELGGHVVAALHLEALDGHMLVENIAVRPEMQRRGLGDALLARGEEIAREMGYAVVRLYTNSRMGGNTEWYLARDYAIEREEAFGNGNRVHFVKKLAG
ncbi:MAG: GNAT family N-acetyltransferase [Alphaproteobacteria bacterium]|nr:GNAT family N-acetyltransferase [Alphaproteobacteria bacterium]